jgi:DNA replication protein DnaC
MLRRLNLPTVRRLWSELQVRVEQESLGYAAYLETLMGEEIAHRGQTRIRRVTRAERFPFLRTVEEFDFAFQSGLRKGLLGSYLGPEFVSEGRSLIAYGPSGTGKTHVAVAIAYKAIQNGSDARFVTASHLLDELSSASREGGLREALSAYTHPGVLVVDEVGYLSLGPDAANVLFQVVKDRYLHRRPMVFTTNKPIEAWGKVLHDGDLAEAILDRVLERGRVLHFKGPSFRTRHLPTKEGARISGTHFAHTFLVRGQLRARREDGKKREEGTGERVEPGLLPTLAEMRRRVVREVALALASRIALDTTKEERMKWANALANYWTWAG